MMKEDDTFIVPHTSAIKPLLEDHHMFVQVLYYTNCLVAKPDGRWFYHDG